MAEFVAERAQECTERRDFLAHCRPHPYPDHHGFVGVVPEKLGAPTLADSERPCCKHADATSRDFVKPRCGIQKVCAGAADIHSSPSLHCRFEGFCNGQQSFVLRQIEGSDPVALQHAGRGSEPTGPIQQPSSGGAWVRNLRFGGVIPHHCPSFSTPGSEPYSRAPARIQQVVFIL